MYDLNFEDFLLLMNKKVSQFQFAKGKDFLGVIYFIGQNAYLGDILDKLLNLTSRPEERFLVSTKCV